MTRFLSESLQATEPYFRLGLRNLERLHGNPSNDIRVTAEVKAATRHKILELGLDPNDTSPEELYHALHQKLALDDAHLVKTLRTRAATYANAEGNIGDGMIHALETLPEAKHCFALKSSSFKGIIKKMPPKKS